MPRSGTHTACGNQAQICIMTLHDALEQVRMFHQTFGIAQAAQPTAAIGEEQWRLRYALMHEENGEYLAAAQSGDLVGVADALGDMLYILCGTLLKHGLQHRIEAVFEEIQRSNMSKLGADGLPLRRADGKILKGEGYFRPDIATILAR